MAIVYIATNKTNAHEYIGVTSGPLGKRQKEHFYVARLNIRRSPFHSAIRKYGEASFDWSIVGQFETMREAFAEEIRLIAERKPSYNVTRGGEGIVGVPRTPEWTAKVVAKLKGRVRPALFHPVICLNDGVRYESVKSAASAYGLSSKNLVEVLGGRQASCGGYAFAYAENVEDDAARLNLLTKALDRKKNQHSKSAATLSRAIRCETDGLEYKSIVSAATYYGISISYVILLAKTGKKSLSGLMFSFVDRNKKTWGGRPGIPVRCIEDGQVFSSIKAAAVKYNLDPSSISKVCRHKKRHVSVSGLRFEYVKLET